jgi:hypothetical protein
MHHPTCVAAGVALALLAAAPIARGATFCADTPSDIADAMDIAKANGEDDEIRVVAGHYPLAQTLRLGSSETEPFALAFSGRWNADCSEPSSLSASTLDGQDQRPMLALALDSDTDVSLADLAFVGGFVAFNESGGVLEISGGRNVLIERVQLFSNTLENGEAPLHVATGGEGSVLTLRNSLLFDNIAHAITAAHLQSQQGEVYIIGNTITSNASAISCPCSALNYAGTSAYAVSNNLVWGNEGGDVFINPLTAIHLNNDIGELTAGGNPPGSGSSGDLSVDPMFDADGVHLSPESPLIDAGITSAPGGIGDLDGGRGPRLLGDSVDIGAFEFATDLIFRDSFDGVPLP